MSKHDFQIGDRIWLRYPDGDRGTKLRLMEVVDIFENGAIHFREKTPPPEEFQPEGISYN